MREPLTPPDCDLQDSKYMPMYVQQMLNSSFNAMADDTAWRAGVTLWMKSWHQVPAASLPDEDEELCQFAGLGRDVRTWKKIRGKALRGWITCSDGRIYHPILAEAALEAWIGALLARISSGEGNAKRWNTTFDRRPIEAQVQQSYVLLRALNPRADAVQKIERRNAKDRKQDSEPPPDDIPPGYQPDIPPGSQPEPEPELVVIGGGGNARDASRDVLGWPEPKTEWISTLIAETGCADMARDDWPYRKASIVTGWHETDRFEWDDVVAGIRSVMATVNATDPPKSWRYFAAAIARAKRDRTTITPEAQPHERRNQPFRSTSERREDSTIAAFRNVFGGPAAGEDEPGHAA